MTTGRVRSAYAFRYSSVPNDTGRLSRRRASGKPTVANQLCVPPGDTRHNDHRSERGNGHRTNFPSSWGWETRLRLPGAVRVPESPKSKERIEVTSGHNRTLGF